MNRAGWKVFVYMNMVVSYSNWLPIDAVGKFAKLGEKVFLVYFNIVVA